MDIHINDWMNIKCPICDEYLGKVEWTNQRDFNDRALQEVLATETARLLKSHECGAEA